MRYFILRN